MVDNTLDEIFDPVSDRIEKLLLKDKKWALKKKSSLCAEIHRLAGTEIASPTITRHILSSKDPVYNEIKSKIMNSVKYCNNLRIAVLCNDFLDAFYVLRQEQYFITYGEKNVKENLWFHGTEHKNIENICRDNFDWTLYGTANGCIFGQGVYFSSSAVFSSWYCGLEEEMAMVLASVLTSSNCLGNEEMVIPRYCNDKMVDNKSKLRHDTSGNKRNVFVKYDEDEFYPSYVIYFNSTFTAKRNTTKVTKNVRCADEPKDAHVEKMSLDPVGDEDAALKAVIEKFSVLNASYKKTAKGM